MNPQRDVKGAAAAREAGNNSYKKGKWAEAIGHYAQAARLDPSDPAPLLNRAQAYLKLEKWQDVVRDCNTVLGLPDQSKNIKALFRRSLARKELGEEEQVLAIKDLEMVLKLEPGNSAAKDELASLKKEMEKNKKKKDRSTPPSTAKKPSTEKSTAQPDGETRPAVPPLSLAPSSTRRIQNPNAARPEPPKGVEVPIKVVPFFSPRTSLAVQKPAIAGPSRINASVDAEKGSKSAGSGGFVEKRAGREIKKSFAGSDSPSAGKIEPVSHSNTKFEETQIHESERNDVIPPVSGLDMIDRVMHSTTDQERWDILMSIPPGKACAWLDPLIEPDHLATIYQSLLSSTSGPVKTVQAKELVQGLKGMKRWKMIQGLLSKKEKEVLRLLNERCGPE